MPNEEFCIRGFGQIRGRLYAVAYGIVAEVALIDDDAIYTTDGMEVEVIDVQQWHWSTDAVRSAWELWFEEWQRRKSHCWQQDSF